MGFNGNQSISPGYVILIVTVKGLPCPSKFFVLPADALENEVTLGAQWQRTYKAYIHWYDNQVYLRQKIMSVKYHLSHKMKLNNLKW